MAKLRRQRESLSPVGKATNLFLDITVGYGYRIWRALVLLLVVGVIGVVVFGMLHPSDIKAKSVSTAPPFNAWSYTIDTLIPLINLHERDAFNASGLAQVAVTVFVVIGWALTTAVVAGLTGVFKRD